VGANAQVEYNLLSDWIDPDGDQFYLKSGDEMDQLFGHIPGAMENTLAIAERCNVVFNFDEHHLPHFDVPEGETSKTYLRKVCEREIPRLYGDTSDELKKRLDYELDVIGTMGFEDYFLIVWDYVRYAREHDILVGPGRGSAAAKYFLFESDEYERHFMPYHPEYSIITNIDFDHPDYFTSLEDVFNAFNDYAKQISKGLFIYGEDKELRRITSSAPIYYYGFDKETNDFVASNLLRSTTGSTFNVHFRGEDLGQFHIPTFGRHNIMNAIYDRIPEAAFIGRSVVTGYGEGLGERLSLFSPPFGGAD